MYVCIDRENTFLCQTVTSLKVSYFTLITQIFKCLEQSSNLIIFGKVILFLYPTLFLRYSRCLVEAS